MRRVAEIARLLPAWMSRSDDDDHDLQAEDDRASDGATPISDSQQMIRPDDVPWELLSWAAAGMAAVAAVEDDRWEPASRSRVANLLWRARLEAGRSIEHGKLILSRIYCRQRRHQREIRGE